MEENESVEKKHLIIINSLIFFDFDFMAKNKRKKIISEIGSLETLLFD